MREAAGRDPEEPSKSLTPRANRRPMHRGPCEPHRGPHGPRRSQTEAPGTHVRNWDLGALTTAWGRGAGLGDRKTISDQARGVTVELERTGRSHRGLGEACAWDQETCEGYKASRDILGCVLGHREPRQEEPRD